MRKMMPIGPLMIEHRVIDRMVAALRRELATIDETHRADPAFLGKAVEFIRQYADRCHHGKEEDILFRALSQKELPTDLARIMNELIAEHRTGRETVRRLDSAIQQYVAGQDGALALIREYLRAISEFYPAHIAKEDRSFFLPAMKLFSQTERDELLAQGHEFDSGLLHDQYLQFVSDVEGRRTGR